MSEEKKIQAGDLYKKITVAGREFEIRYMDFGTVDPDQPGYMIPDFPYFEDEPMYTDDQYPFTNRMNDSCEFYATNAEHPDRWCNDCIYFKDAVEEIGVCRCTARKRRGIEKPKTGKTMKIAVVGNLPTAVKVIRNEYDDVQFFNYERATDMPLVDHDYDLVLVQSYAGEGLGIRELTYTGRVGDDKVEIPVRLLHEPPCESAEIELAVFIRCTLAKKVNQEEKD